MRKDIGSWLIFFLGFTVTMVMIFVFPLFVHEDLEVYFFQTQRGDSIGIQTPDGHFILIDGGISSDVVREIFTQKPFWDRTIDMLIVTHPDSDHINGAYEVLQVFDVQQVLITGVMKQHETYENFLSLISEKNIPLSFANASEDWDFGDVFIDIMYPFDFIAGKKMEDINNSSIVFRLEYSETSMLFTGDIEEEIEYQLLSSGEDLSADVIKVPHHGSKSSSSLSFLQSVNPTSAIFTVGKRNPFGHPHDEVLDRYEDLGIDYDVNKTKKIMYYSDGYTWRKTVQ